MFWKTSSQIIFCMLRQHIETSLNPNKHWCVFAACWFIWVMKSILYSKTPGKTKCYLLYKCNSNVFIYTIYRHGFGGMSVPIHDFIRCLILVSYTSALSLQTRTLQYLSMSGIYPSCLVTCWVFVDWMICYMKYYNLHFNCCHILIMLKW